MQQVPSYFVPVFRVSSSLSATAFLFCSEIRAKTLRMALDLTLETCHKFLWFYLQAKIHADCLSDVNQLGLKHDPVSHVLERCQPT